jgi:hypothetical protein
MSNTDKLAEIVNSHLDIADLVVDRMSLVMALAVTVSLIAAVVFGVGFMLCVSDIRAKAWNSKTEEGQDVVSRASTFRRTALSGLVFLVGTASAATMIVSHEIEARDQKHARASALTAAFPGLPMETSQKQCVYDLADKHQYSMGDQCRVQFLNGDDLTSLTFQRVNKQIIVTKDNTKVVYGS